ncbi:hypothetical protein JHN63_10105, partial [Streptomyces sp. MBT65]|nr:hypothetical protein [Streptomyces sp. MBT65]
MTRPSHPTPLNRTALGVTGLALAVAGTWLLTSDRLPSWWPGADTGTVLLDAGRLARLHAETWWAPTTTATAITLTLLFAFGSLRQLRPPTARHLAL